MLVRKEDIFKSAQESIHNRTLTNSIVANNTREKIIQREKIKNTKVTMSGKELTELIDKQASKRTKDYLDYMTNLFIFSTSLAIMDQNIQGFTKENMLDVLKKIGLSFESIVDKTISIKDIQAQLNDEYDILINVDIK